MAAFVLFSNSYKGTNDIVPELIFENDYRPIDIKSKNGFLYLFDSQSVKTNDSIIQQKIVLTKISTDGKIIKSKTVDSNEYNANLKYKTVLNYKSLNIVNNYLSVIYEKECENTDVFYMGLFDEEFNIVDTISFSFENSISNYFIDTNQQNENVLILRTSSLFSDYLSDSAIIKSQEYFSIISIENNKCIVAKFPLWEIKSQIPNVNDLAICSFDIKNGILICFGAKLYSDNMYKETPVFFEIDIAKKAIISYTETNYTHETPNSRPANFFIDNKTAITFSQNMENLQGYKYNFITKKLQVYNSKMPTNNIVNLYKYKNRILLFGDIRLDKNVETSNIELVNLANLLFDGKAYTNSIAILNTENQYLKHIAFGENNLESIKKFTYTDKSIYLLCYEIDEFFGKQRTKIYKVSDL
jgi:hypothetical protein